MMRIFLSIFFTLILAITASAEVNKAAIERQFANWLSKDFYAEALKNGISADVYKQTLLNIKPNLQLPDLVILGENPKAPKRQHQAEFGSPANYFSEKSIATLVSNGKTQFKAQSKTLKSIEKQYGVPQGIAVAVWGRESAYGTVKIPYNAFEVLATKAFMSNRKDMFRDELLAALKIVQNSYMDANSMKSSWAGALGQPQFMPTSYLKYAVDFDGDGHRNIWTSTPDTLASIANYLKQNGWKAKMPWGYEVYVPDSVSCSLEGPDQGKTLSEWQQKGIKPVSGKEFSSISANQKVYLLMPAGRLGPAFLVTDNFYVLKSYNMSDLYALFIGTVADRIENRGGIVTPWKNVDFLYRSDVLALQNNLQKLGFDIGKADGLAGFKTRRSIGIWQEKHGQKPTCFPSQQLVKSVH